MIHRYIQDEIKAHAISSAPKESCGIVVLVGEEQVYLKANNLSSFDDNFILDPASIVLAEDMGEILFLVHSHVNTSAELSGPDKVSHSRGSYNWAIYSIKDNRLAEYEKPISIDIPPLLGRQFFFGIQDCYSIIKDYYKLELNIDLPDKVREDKFWARGENLYLEGYLAAGFVQVPITELKEHDVLLMKLGITSIPNHGAVYTKDNMILHHIQGRLSEKSQYLRYWRDITTNVLRHSSQL